MLKSVLKKGSISANPSDLHSHDGAVGTSPPYQYGDGVGDHEYDEDVGPVVTGRGHTGQDRTQRGAHRARACQRVQSVSPAYRLVVSVSETNLSESVRCLRSQAGLCPKIVRISGVSED